MLQTARENLATVGEIGGIVVLTGGIGVPAETHFPQPPVSDIIPLGGAMLWNFAHLADPYRSPSQKKLSLVGIGLSATLAVASVGVGLVDHSAADNLLHYSFAPAAATGAWNLALGRRLK